MTIEIKVPTLPESVTDATIAKWYKKEGDFIDRDENLVDLETDKVMLEVPAIKAGIIKQIKVAEGSTVTADTVLAIIDDSAKASDVETSETAKPNAAADEPSTATSAETIAENEAELSPAVRRLVAEHGLDAQKIVGTGKGGRITKEDVEKHLQAQKTAAASSAKLADAQTSLQGIGSRLEKRAPMSRLRARIAERLVGIQQEAAILTTFNEVNMQPVMDLRNKYKDIFEKTHQVRLGFMSFFTKAVTEALKRFPVVNASVDGNDIIYHNFCDIGIAVGGGPRGLVVPVIRNAETMSMAAIEKSIREYAGKAESGKLTIEEMTGGTFTITNGGVFGSLLSTPIINPPQSAILGMHKIQERVVVENGQMVVRPMMYIALSYDHRIIDGSDSVRFLVAVKELIEDPSRLLLEV